MYSDIETKNDKRCIESNRKGTFGIRYADRAKPINCKYINSKNEGDKRKKKKKSRGI